MFKQLFSFLILVCAVLNVSAQKLDEAYLKYIEKNKDKYNNEFLIPIEERLRIWCKIANTIRKLHQNGIIHRDIKPENIVLRKSKIAHQTSQIAHRKSHI